MANIDLKQFVDKVIKEFSKGNLKQNSLKLFQTIGYSTEKTNSLDSCDFQTFNRNYNVNNRLSAEKAISND